MSRKLRSGQFYGATSKAAQIPGFRLAVQVYAPRLRIDQHSHELSHFCYVLEGYYVETLGSQSRERRPSNLIYYPPELSHAELLYNQGRQLLIEIEDWRIEHIKQYCRLRSEPLTVNSLAHLAARIYREFWQMDEFSSMILEGLSLELLASMSRASASRVEGSPPMWLHDVKQILRDNFVDPPSLEELAKIVNVHPVHLARVFRRFEYSTIGEYVRRLRIEFACRRMASTKATLAEIALDAGFSDQTHFSKWFKRLTGLTPGEFRTSVRSR